MEKLGFQIVLAAAACVPVFGGIYGLLNGISGAAPDLQSHYHYLSGLLLGIGIAFATCALDPETKTARFQTLVGIVLLGGLARLGYSLTSGTFTPVIWFTLFMELAAPVLMACWQLRIARGNLAA